MCGLVGYCRHPDSADVDGAKLALVEGLLIAETRGSHATGFAALAGPGGREGALLWKAAVPARVAVQSEPFRQALEAVGPGDTIVIGHTRHATQNNAREDRAAHPFREGEVVGAHNGIIANWQELAKDLKREDFIVDSQVAFALLDRKKNPAKALERLGGYFALSWAKAGELHLLRSERAELHAGYVPALRTLFWYSTKKGLLEMFRQLGLAEKDFQAWELRSGTLYRYDPTQFTEAGTGCAKTAVDLKGARDNWSAWKRFGRITSGQQEMFYDRLERPAPHARRVRVGFPDTPKTPLDLPAEDRPPRVRQGQETLSGLRTYVHWLEGRLDGLEGRARQQEGVIRAQQQEIENLWRVLEDAGLLPEADTEPCEVCNRLLDPSTDEALKLPQGGYVHQTCLLTPGALEAQDEDNVPF